MFPSTVTPQPRNTLLPIFGWRSKSLDVPVPPKVVPCRNEQLVPTTAVSPMTTPVPWSIIKPPPIRAPGWMSTPKTSVLRAWMTMARSRRPWLHKTWEKR